MIKPLFLSIILIPTFSAADDWRVKDVKVTYQGCTYLRDNANIRAYVSDGHGEPQSNGCCLFISNPKSNKYTFFYMGPTLGQGIFRPLEPGNDIELDLGRYVTAKDRDKVAEVVFTAKFVKVN